MGIRSFAQNFEDVVLWRALSDAKSGFFIDIGAQHPLKDSVSKAFSENGWRGIHVEPVSAYAELLRADRPTDIVIEAVVADIRGVCDFYHVEGTGLSTAKAEIAQEHAAQAFPVRPIVVPAILLDDVMELAYSEEIHWLKIDVEGAEKAVLNGWRTSKKRPWVVVVEATYPGKQTSMHEQWEYLLLEKQYTHVYSDGLNRFYLAEDHIDLKDRFEFPPNIFDGFQLFDNSYYVTNIVDGYDKRLAVSDDRSAALQLAIEEAQQSALQREHSLHEVHASKLAEREAALRAEIERAQREALQREIATQKAHTANLAEREAERDRVQRDALQREQSLREMHASKLAEREAALRVEIERAQREISAHEAQVESANATLFEERQCREALIGDLEALRDELGHIGNDFLRVTSSRSWRFSAPLRFIFGEPAPTSRQIFQNAVAPSFESDRTDSQVSDDIGNITAKTAESTMAGSGLLDGAQGENRTIMSNADMRNVIDLLSLRLPDFVRESYRTLLGRLPDSSEMSSQCAVLRSGLGRTAFLADIYQSPEFAALDRRLMIESREEDFIESLYAYYLGRNADAGGRDHYQALLAKGRSRLRIRKGIARSREARTVNTLRSGIEKIISDELKGRHWFWRWFSRSRIDARRANLTFEVMSNQGFHLGSTQSGGGGVFPLVTTDLPGRGHYEVDKEFAALLQPELVEVGRGARKVLSRLRHLSGNVSSFGRGH